MKSSWDEVYREPVKGSEDAMTEDDAVALLLERSKAMRRRLLAGTLAVSFVAGALVAWAYISTAFRVFGLVIGASFAAGALAVFVMLRLVTGVLMRGMEAAWAADLSRKSGVSTKALKESLRMLR